MIQAIIRYASARTVKSDKSEVIGKKLPVEAPIRNIQVVGNGMSDILQCIAC